MRTEHILASVAVAALLAGCAAAVPPPRPQAEAAPAYSSYSYTSTAAVPVTAALVPVPTTTTTIVSGPAVIAPPVIAPGATTTTTTIVTPVPARLGQMEVVTLLSNNTVSGLDADGTPYQAYLAADGRYRMVHGGRGELGTWRVLADGRLCAVRAVDGVEQCHTMWREGNVIRFDRPRGMSAGEVAILVGNPQGL